MTQQVKAFDTKLWWPEFDQEIYTVDGADWPHPNKEMNKQIECNKN